VVALGWQQFVRANPPMPPGPLDPREYPGAAALLNHAPTPKARMRPTVFEGPVDLPMTTFQHCITPNREVLSCEYGDLRATRTIALVGSSHPENWLPAFELLGLQHHFKVVTYVKMGCPLTLVDLPSYAATAFPECRKWSEDVLDRLAARRPNWVFTMGTRQLLDDGDNTPPEFVDVWSALTRRGLNVMVMRDTPWLRRSGVYFRAVDCLARGGSGVSCGMPRSGAFGPVNPAAGPAGAFPRVFPLDLTDAFCGPTQCRSVVGNMLVYRDEHHITASYMRTIAPALGSRVGAITRWW
ncbi:MAG: acyltransferase, partial [Mycobacteriaceae bacterium]|nr:acyltransferase [Mycobacteriaceae bacterium]